MSRRCSTGSSSGASSGQEARQSSLLKFPSMEKAKAFYDSPEYRAAIKAREDIAVMRMVLIEGV